MEEDEQQTNDLTKVATKTGPAYVLDPAGSVVLSGHAKQPAERGCSGAYEFDWVIRLGRVTDDSIQVQSVTMRATRADDDWVYPSTVQLESTESQYARESVTVPGMSRIRVGQTARFDFGGKTITLSAKNFEALFVKMHHSGDAVVARGDSVPDQAWCSKMTQVDLIPRKVCNESQGVEWCSGRR